ncbi:hypothetical protein C5S31_10110 [ANME-1 cluster archaeon GoMg2]|nr:hypothetical protein [ANME-1 cluster archaeon GoMg2]
MRAKAFIIFVVVLTLYLQITAVSASQIILEDADTIWNTTTAYSEELTNVTSTVKIRIQTEYANTIYHNNLNPSTDLFDLTTNVTPRILTEYANTIYRNELKEITAELVNITGEVPPKITIVHANSNFYEALAFPKELINDTTSPIITNVIATEITNNSATLKWDTNEIADSLVKYGNVSGFYAESEGYSLFVTKHTIELTGLLPGTCYYFVVNSTDQSGNLKESIEYGFSTIGGLKVFDTGASENPYPSISGIHNGTITPNQTISVSKLYTYPCEGTGGHSEYAKFYNDTWSIESQPWVGYQEGGNIYFNQSFTLVVNETYNYTIRTGSYPQIHHTANLSTPAGFITCSEFRDVNGGRHGGWIPAIILGVK